MIILKPESVLINKSGLKLLLLLLLFDQKMISQISFSVNSGYYTAPFNTTLTSQIPSSQIIYTLDGSFPLTSPDRFVVNSPAVVHIDPENTSGRNVTPAVVIRACLIRSGQAVSKPVSRTYIFPEKVRNQHWPGGEWPNGSVNGQVIDLEMDRKVVDDPEYTDLLDDALLYIPAISIITDLKNLFDPDSGIYVNAYDRGLEWERECSIEWINSNGAMGFMANAGLRIRGGSSRSPSFPKHGFRLYFREKYGNDKLYFPLFGNEGTDEYDKIDLRTDQDYAWSNGWDNSSFVREVFSRDTQRDLGQPYTRSRYCHLYLNGMYWGLYQTQERPDARYASSYLGGDTEDYDVLKIKSEDGSYSIEAADGNLESWEGLWNKCSAGFAPAADYFLLEGKDENGMAVRDGEIYVDINNLIDYMLIIFYTGNFDSPTSAFLKNKKGNNFYALDNRDDRSHGFVFIIHDAENAMLTEPIYPGEGLYENRVNIAERDDDMKMVVGDFQDFHPQWLHYKLTENKEYRSRFADRAYRHLNQGGALFSDSSLMRLNKRINEVDLAVVAESARWGDAKTDGSYSFTRNYNWIPEINKLREEFIPFRTEIVKEQLREAGLYPELEAPVVISPEGPVTAELTRLEPPLNVQIDNPNPSGTIYYSINGNDPRLPGGGVSSTAIPSTATVNLTLSVSTRIIARVLSNGTWSALREVNFVKQQQDFKDLKVTELHYHPADFTTDNDTIDGKDLEFIEFKNTGKEILNIGSLVLDSAVHYQFPATELLLPEQFYVIVSKPSKFYDYYGMTASGNFKGNFSNSGEEVLLSDSKNKTIINFIYDDNLPWPIEADGGGYSLTAREKNPAGDPADFNYWIASMNKDGNPFADNNTLDTIAEETEKNGKLLVYPNPSSGLVTIQFLTEEAGKQIEIWLITLTGKSIIHTFIENPSTLDLSTLEMSAGIYFLKVKYEKQTEQVPIILLRKR